MDSLREAMYELIETRDVSEIKVVDLIRKAGVSRGGFYKNFYLVTDVLKDDKGFLLHSMLSFRKCGNDIVSLVASIIVLFPFIFSMLWCRVGVAFQPLDQVVLHDQLASADVQRREILAAEQIISSCPRDPQGRSDLRGIQDVRQIIENLILMLLLSRIQKAATASVTADMCMMLLLDMGGKKITVLGGDEIRVGNCQIGFVLIAHVAAPLVVRGRVTGGILAPFLITTLIHHKRAAVMM